MFKFRPTLNVLEDRWTPDGTGIENPPPPPPYDPGAPPAQTQPVTPTIPGSGPITPTPGYPGG